MKGPYFRINLILAGIIACIMLYSGIFSAEKTNHPIPCIYSTLTGQTCPGCGLSRSFSAMIRLEFNNAKLYNVNGPPIFAFFFVQFVLRLIVIVILSWITTLRTWLWLTDSICAILFFAWAFSGLFMQMLKPY